MKKILFIIGLLLIMMQANAQQAIQRQIDATASEQFSEEPLLAPKPVTADKTAALGRYVRSFTLLTADDLVLAKIAADAPPALEIKVPLEGAEVTLQLIKSRVVNDRTQFTVQSGAQQEKINYQPGAYYYGVIKGQPHTLVAISFFNNNIIGVISNERGNHVLGKSNTLDSSGNEYIIYNEKDLLIKDAFACGAENKPMSLPLAAKSTTYSINNCVNIYIETDYQVFLNQGSSTTNVLNFVSGLFNVVRTLYQNESINTAISQVNVWTSTDPYAAAANSSAALTAFGNAMSGGFNGDLAHLFSARSLGGGIAWLNTLCYSDPRYKTAVSGNLNSSTPSFPTYSWNAMVVTHETGHNLGSPHTHACAWNGNSTAIDGCYTTEGGCPSPGVPSGGGTIMSYCHLTSAGINFNLGFGPQPGNLIRNYVYNAACLTPCCESDKVINFPITQSVTYEVTNTITASNSVTISSGLVAFDAGQSITLLPGFSASVGSGTFWAYIDGCGGVSPQAQTQSSSLQQSANSSLTALNVTTAEQFSVYPNPSDGLVKIEGPVAIIKAIWVTDLLGKKWYTLTKPSGSSLDLRFLPKGMYLINIETGKAETRYKIVIM